MKLNFALNACLTAGISILSVIPASIAYAGNGVPDYIVQYPGKPDIAVFKDVKQYYALGCPALRSLWSRVPVQTAVSSDVFNQIMRLNPVAADIPCNGSVDPYVTTPRGLGALVITHRDGKPYRHYINSAEFIRAVGGGNSISISGEEFSRRFPNHGTDFRLSP